MRMVDGCSSSTKVKDIYLRGLRSNPMEVKMARYQRAEGFNAECALIVTKIKST